MVLERVQRREAQEHETNYRHRRLGRHGRERAQRRPKQFGECSSRSVTCGGVERGTVAGPAIPSIPAPGRVCDAVSSQKYHI